MSDPHDLSEREIEILRLLATGASNKEIAQKLFISANTVKVHLRNIFAKIGAASRTEAAMFAVNAGLVASPAAGVAQDEALKKEEIGLTGPLAAGDKRPALSVSWAMWLLGLVAVIAVAAGGARFFRETNPASLAAQTAVTIPPSAWQDLASLPLALKGAAAAALEDQLILIGGEGEAGVSSAAWKYDTGAGAWSRLADKPTPVSEAGAALIGGMLYVPGGRTSAVGTGRQSLTSSLEIYDPRLDAWKPGRPLPWALSGYALAAFEGKLYVFGGWDGETPRTETLVYDPERDEWQRKAPLPEKRAYACAAVASGRIYLIGGFDGKKASRSVWTYQPGRDDGRDSPWQEAQALPAGREKCAAAAVADILYVVGGADIASAGQPALSGLVYAPNTQNWQPFDLPAGENGGQPALAARGPYLYVLGGEKNGQPSANALLFQAIYTVSFPVIQK